MAQLKPGTRLRSAVCPTEVMIVAAPKGDVTVTCGGAPMAPLDAAPAAGAARRRIEASGASHVGILDVNSLAVPVGLFAAAWAGRPFVPLNYRLTAEEVDALVARIAPAYLVAEPERVERLSACAGARA